MSRNFLAVVLQEQARHIHPDDCRLCAQQSVAGALCGYHQQLDLEAAEKGDAVLPTRDYLAARLTELPELIEAAEGRVLNAQLTVAAAKEELCLKEGLIICADPPLLTGKNAEQRESQLKALTRELRRQVADADRALQVEQITLRAAQNQLSAAKAMARLIGGGD